MAALIPELERLLSANNQGTKFTAQQQFMRAAPTQKPEICSPKLLRKKINIFTKNRPEESLNGMNLRKYEDKKDISQSTNATQRSPEQNTSI